MISCYLAKGVLVRCISCVTYHYLHVCVQNDRGRRGGGNSSSDSPLLQ